MRPIAMLLTLTFGITTLYAQIIPAVETEYTIHKNEKQQYNISLQKNYLLKVILVQKGIDLEIAVYKKGDSVVQDYFDSPNGENGPERISFESPSTGDYTLVVKQITEDSVADGRYTIRLVSVTPIQAMIDTSFSNGSGIQIKSLTRINIENLTNLGMLWGFLKYHLPSVAQCDYNWDAELFRILPRILSADSKEKSNAELEKWVDKLGKPNHCTSCNDIQPSAGIKVMPDYGYLFLNGNLGGALVEKLNDIRNNRNEGDNYYVKLAPGIGNPGFDHEKAYPSMIYPDAGYRLLGLFRYWNIIQYFFPYKYLIGEDWNKVLPEFIPLFVDAKDSTQYVLACLSIIARIHDTHANIWGNNRSLNDYFGQFQAPLKAEFIRDTLVVTGYYADITSLKEKVKPGDIVSKINGIPVDRLVKDNLYLTPASNYERQLWILARKLFRSKREVIDLEIERDAVKKTVSVPCIAIGQISMIADLNPNPTDSSYKILDGGIGYLFPGRYKDEQLASIKKAFEHTRGIIIDMRTYPSDFMPFTFCPFIKPDSSAFVRFTVGNINNPGLFTYGQPIRNGVLNPGYYKGPVVELVNSITLSQAEYTTMALQSAPHVTVIGSKTAGADGNVSAIPLPGGITTYISGIGVYYPDGGETQRKGIRIDMQVGPTIEGIKKGKDELLDKAIELINTKQPKP